MFLAFGRDWLSNEGSLGYRCLPGAERSQEKQDSILGKANLELIFFPFQIGRPKSSSAVSLTATTFLPDDLKDPRKLKVVSADKTVGLSDIVKKRKVTLCFASAIFSSK